MKKFIIAAALCCAAATVNAQVWDESNFGGLTPEMSKNSNPEFPVQDKVTILNDEDATRYKGNHQDEIKTLAGNNQKPVILYTEDNHGYDINLFAVGGWFADHKVLGGGVGAGWEARRGGIDGRFIFQRARPDKESDDVSVFLQERAEFRAYWKPVQFLNHHAGIKLGIAGTFQLSQFLDQEKYEWSGKTLNPDGSTTTHTTTRSDLDIREFTSGGYVFAEGYWHKAFSPWGLFVGASYGLQQNILLNTNKFYQEFKIYAGVSFRFNKHKKFNHPGMKFAGYNTEAEVWQLRNEMRPYQTPSK
jgi:hypothetical protein